MRVLRNLLTAAISEIRSNDSSSFPIEQKRVGNEWWVRAVEPTSMLTTYTPNMASNPAPLMTHCIFVNPEVDCNLTVDLSTASTFCKAGEWTRLHRTDANARGASVLSIDPAALGIWIRTRHPISVEGSIPPDIWLPPESTLTPEQRLTLPPYGEYGELRTF